MKLYRQIKCIDRLPVVSGYYYTNEDHCFFNGEYWENGYCYIIEPDYWLEEFELPSEEEIIKEFTDENGVIDTSGLFGVNFILSKIKQC